MCTIFVLRVVGDFLYNEFTFIYGELIYACDQIMMLNS